MAQQFRLKGGIIGKGTGLRRGLDEKERNTRTPLTWNFGARAALFDSSHTPSYISLMMNGPNIKGPRRHSSGTTRSIDQGAWAGHEVP